MNTAKTAHDLVMETIYDADGELHCVMYALPGETSREPSRWIFTLHNAYRVTASDVIDGAMDADTAAEIVFALAHMLTARSVLRYPELLTKRLRDAACDTMDASPRLRGTILAIWQGVKVLCRVKEEEARTEELEEMKRERTNANRPSEAA